MPKNLLILVFCLSTILMQAQKRFKAGVILGFNASQVDGDRHVGYRKFGFSAGVEGVTILSDQWRLNMELLFSQRGSKSGTIENRPNAIYTVKALDMRLNYVEIPVLIQYLHYYRGDKTDYFYRYRFSGGVSFGKLLGSTIKEPNPFTNDPPNTLFIRPFQSSFSKNDLSLVLGLTMMMTKNLGLTLRHSVSLNPLYKAETSPDSEGKNLSGYFITGQVLYEF